MKIIVCLNCKKEKKVHNYRTKANFCSTKCKTDYKKSAVEVGKKYNLLLILGEVEPKKYIYKGREILYRRVKCLCDCGVISDHDYTAVKGGAIKSCGCQARNPPLRQGHGLCKHPLYSVWNGMLQRCTNKNNLAYKNYGGRGVVVCEEWKNSFEYFYLWAINNGWEKGLQLDKDKIGTGLLYSPNTCCFLTPIENNKYKRNSK